MSDLAVRPVTPVSDTLTMVGRCLRLSRREVDALLTSLMLPIILMLLFVYLFGGAINTGGEYVTYVVPGVIVLCAAFGAGTTAVNVSRDLTGGIVDRLRSMDVSGVSVLTGHVVASTVRNIVSTALVFGVAFAIGFRPNANALEWLAAVGILVLFVVAISWLATAIGVLTRTPDAANGFTFLVMFLPYPSSAFVPIDTMPSWIHGFAKYQPVTPVIETMRGFLLGTPADGSLWKALVWCVGIAAVSVVLAAALFRRRVR